MTAPTVTTTLAGVLADVAEGGYRIRRSWPRSEHHLLLELSVASDPSAPTVAAQWFSATEPARAVADATAGSTCTGRLVLQPCGTDQKMPALAAMAGAAGSRLVSHRAERRAVVRMDAEDATRYAKLVPPRRLPALERTTRWAAHLPMPTPAVVEVDPRRGAVVTEALPGVTLHELLDGRRATTCCEAAGVTLAELHRLPVPPDLPEHSVDSEAQVTRRWQALARSYAASSPFPRPQVHFPAWPASPENGTGAESPGPPVVLHRDFHDKQLLVAADDRIGVLDFDLAAVGEAALDLANLLVHLRLRQLQGVVADSRPLEEAVLRGYAPSPQVASQLACYGRLAWERLAAVYAFRPVGEPT